MLIIVFIVMKCIKFYKIKPEIRILGIDDGPFNLWKDRKTVLIGAIFRGGVFMDGVLKSDVTIDGMDITDVIINMVKNTKHKDLRIIMLDGITYAGFNIVDILRLFRETGLGVIVITRKFPCFNDIKKAIKNFSDFEERWALIEAAGKPRKVKTQRGFIYMQKCGVTLKDAKKIIKISSTRSIIPEPLRIAHLIAGGVVLGESRGNA